MAGRARIKPAGKSGLLALMSGHARLVPGSTGRAGGQSRSDKTGYVPGTSKRIVRTDLPGWICQDGFGMADETGKRERKDSRQARLKLALRENLKRRKAQARERSQMAEPPSTADEASLNGEPGKRDDASS